MLSVIPRPMIQSRIPLDRPRLRFRFFVGSGETTGMSQLQSDNQIIAAPEPFCVFVDQIRSQCFDFREVFFRDQELVRVRASVMPHRNRFASPNQLRTTDRELSPPRRVRSVGFPQASHPSLPSAKCRNDCRSSIHPVRSAAQALRLPRIGHARHKRSRRPIAWCKRGNHRAFLGLRLLDKPYATERDVVAVQMR